MAFITAEKIADDTDDAMPEAVRSALDKIEIEVALLKAGRSRHPNLDALNAAMDRLRADAGDQDAAPVKKRAARKAAPKADPAPAGGHRSAGSTTPPTE